MAVKALVSKFTEAFDIPRARDGFDHGGEVFLLLVRKVVLVTVFTGIIPPAAFGPEIVEVTKLGLLFIQGLRRIDLQRRYL